MEILRISSLKILRNWPGDEARGDEARGGGGGEGQGEGGGAE